MAEYVAHVHLPALDGVMFRSVQRAGGVNIVLFGRDGFEVAAQPQGEAADPVPILPLPLLGPAAPTLEFPAEFVAESAKLFITRSIEYQHQEAWFTVHDGDVFVHDDAGVEDIDPERALTKSRSRRSCSRPSCCAVARA